MVNWSMATATRLVRERKGCQEWKVRMDSGASATAVHYTDSGMTVGAGSRIIVNTTAVDLGLGSGGDHFVHAVLPGRDEELDGLLAPGGRMSGGESGPPAPGKVRSGGVEEGHIMKLRYTSAQRRVLAAEEEASPYHRLFRGNRILEGMPVLIGELHSMLPAAVCWLRRASPGLRIAYIMTDGGALPIAYSRHVSVMKEAGWLAGTVTCGHAYGGDVETVNKFTALLAARHVLDADLAIVTMGPGIAGTGTWLGHSGMETGELVNAAFALEGIPVMIPRLSFAESRERHRGLSHHTVASLATAALGRAVVPLPDSLSGPERSAVEAQLEPVRRCGRHELHRVSGVTPEEVQASLDVYPGGPVVSMGRAFADDPAFFLAVSAAAEWVLRRLNQRPLSRGSAHPGGRR